jgi:hypothetical protein
MLTLASVPSFFLQPPAHSTVPFAKLALRVFSHFSGGGPSDRVAEKRVRGQGNDDKPVQKYIDLCFAHELAVQHASRFSGSRQRFYKVRV